MSKQVKEEWIINNRNIFDLSEDIKLTLFTIQYEIYNQLKNKKINSILDYLGTEIDITKEIRLTKSLTIQKAFEEFLGFENFNRLQMSKLKCYLILPYLQLSLLKEYYNKKNKNILTFSEYENQYINLLNSFLTSNIDTDEQDFIKSELNICDNLIKELNKPIYNEISPLNEILEEPCDFKKNLINSIDKRLKFLNEKEKEKVPKVKALFKFIDFLHYNIENFKKYDEIINELNSLDLERNNLRPKKNFKDKIKYDEIQATIKEKFNVVQENIINSIQNKATEFNICDVNKTESFWNWNISEINDLKENFSQNDLSEIFRYKRKYLEYRTKTNCNYFLNFFFNDLDEILKVLFDYFKETEQNEFEAFETKTIQVNSIDEFIKGFKQGYSKISLPSSILNPFISKQQTNVESFQPQQFNENTISKPDENKKELHSHIFKSNAFEVWQSMFVEFDIKESSRTDVKFMFEEMKKEGLIHNTVNQKTFLEWITSVYDDMIVQKISNHSRTKQRLQVYARAKELYNN